MNRINRIAFITSEDEPLLVADDRLAVAPLEALGYSVAPLVWDRDRDLSGFDAFIFRSCWNYHLKFSEFREWVTGLGRLGKPVLNPVEVSLWNLDKKYLLELQRKGASIPRSACVARSGSFDSVEWAAMGSRQIVIRPTVSLSGHDTHLVDTADSDRLLRIWNSMPRNRDVLLQEFIPEIQTAGEVSLLFFNGEFSHAVRKTAADGEFRIHSEYGGKRQSFTPAPELIEQARGILALVDPSLLFARVDMVERPGGAVLIELELVDPSLFLAESPGAVDRWVKAIDHKLSGG